MCSDCDTPLQLGEPPEPPDPSPSYRELVTIYQAANPVQANLIRAVLEADGIVVHLKGEMLTGAIGELPANFAYVEVQVPPESVTRARELALQVERGEA